MVQEAVYALQEMDADRTKVLQTEISSTKDSTHQMKEKWTVYMEEAENNYREDTTAVENERMIIEEGLQECKSIATSGLQQWETAHSTLLTLGLNNTSSMESLLKNGIEVNEQIHSRTAVSLSAQQDINIASRSLCSSIISSLKFDHKACESVDSLIVSCRAELKELEIGHHHKLEEITENAENCMGKNYMVDKESCLTPRRRLINIPSVASIEELRTPGFAELLKSCESKPTISEGKQFSGVHETQPQSLLRDCRVPLTIKN